VINRTSNTDAIYLVSSKRFMCRQSFKFCHISNAFLKLSNLGRQTLKDKLESDNLTVIQIFDN
jgi:hypothetical protein